jgi:DNA-binding NarL/FixJ family response regulator
VGGGALRAAIRAVASGLTVLSDEARDCLVERDPDDLGLAEDEALSVELTERESQVLALLADGASNKVIARALGITPHTAKFHVASIIAKLGATGRTDAVAKAMRMGILMI